MTMQDDAASSVNDERTCQKIDAQLTHPSSLDVLEMAHRDLLVRRNRVGAESQEGRLLSTLIKQLQNYQKETDPVARANLERFMGWTVDAIQRSA